MIQIKTCPLVEIHHKKSNRAYAHWGHKSNVICVSRAIYKLPLSHSIAILAHEVGHALVKGGMEEKANEAAKKAFGTTIIYLPHTPWGTRLEYIPYTKLNRVYGILKSYVDQSSLKAFQPLQSTS